MYKLFGCALNKSVPFEVNYIRILILYGIFILLKSLKTSDFWKETYSEKNLKQNLVLILIVYFGIICLYMVNNGCGFFELKDLYNYNLVNALSNGEVSLNDVPDTTKLEKLKKPYDTVERMVLQRDVDYVWDAAYYNGKYYVYYGAVPALLLMVPYHLITHDYVSSASITLVFGILLIFAFAFLIKKVFLKYFKNESFKYMAFSLIIMIFGTMLIWNNIAPRFYELVTVAGVFFAVCGLGLIIDAEKDNESISLKKVFFGCLFLALAVGCRPTQIFSSILILPFLYKYFVVKTKRNKWKLKFLTIVIIPYFIVALFIMRYNCIRFGSPFEFGEKYQLTINNAKDLKIRLVTLPTGILCNLFGLPTFQATFPFVHSNVNIIDTFGYYYIEDMLGGVFIVSPIAFFCFGIFKILKNKEDKILKALISLLLVVGLVFVSFVSLKAGSTGRYLLDFTWIFVLCGILIFMVILKNLKTEEGKKIFGSILSVIVCYTVILNILSSYCCIGRFLSMKTKTPKQYFDAEYTIMILK